MSRTDLQRLAEDRLHDAEALINAGQWYGCNRWSDAMDQGPLVIEEVNAGAQLIRGFDKYEPVKAAFWLKVSDEPFRYLYIASKQAHGIREAYGEVLRLADDIQSPYFDPFRVKLIDADHPLAEAAAEFNDRFPDRTYNRLGGTLFGGVSVDDAYIYPSPLPAAVA